jgi:hypothetical protein
MELASARRCRNKVDGVSPGQQGEAQRDPDEGQHQPPLPLELRSNDPVVNQEKGRRTPDRRHPQENKDEQGHLERSTAGEQRDIDANVVAPTGNCHRRHREDRPIHPAAQLDGDVPVELVPLFFQLTSAVPAAQAAKPNRDGQKPHPTDPRRRKQHANGPAQEADPNQDRKPHVLADDDPPGRERRNREEHGQKEEIVQIGGDVSGDSQAQGEE